MLTFRRRFRELYKVTWWDKAGGFIGHWIIGFERPVDQNFKAWGKDLLLANAHIRFGSYQVEFIGAVDVTGREK